MTFINSGLTANELYFLNVEVDGARARRNKITPELQTALDVEAEFLADAEELERLYDIDDFAEPDLPFFPDAGDFAEPDLPF